MVQASCNLCQESYRFNPRNRAGCEQWVCCGCDETSRWFETVAWGTTPFVHYCLAIWENELCELEAVSGVHPGGLDFDLVVCVFGCSGQTDPSTLVATHVT